MLLVQNGKTHPPSLTSRVYVHPHALAFGPFGPGAVRPWGDYLVCRSCDGGLVVPYHSHGLTDQELHVLILQSCWATSTPETFSTISSVRQLKATLACGESNTAGCEVSVTWDGKMAPFFHSSCLSIESLSYSLFLAFSVAPSRARRCVCICLCIRGAIRKQG